MSNTHAILGVFSFGPGSGYSVKAELEQGGISWIWGVSYGSIYPKLEAFQDEGLITAVETRTEGRERTLYDLTAKGWEEMHRWLEQRTDFPIPIKDELLLKMFFWGCVRPEDRATLIRHLQERKAVAQQLLGRLNAPLEPHVSQDEFHEMMMDYARHRLSTEVAWCESTIAKLEGPAQPPTQDPRGMFRNAPARQAAAFRQSE